MSRTYRSIIYWGWFDMRNTPEPKLYGRANIDGQYRNWVKNSAKRFVVLEKTGYPTQEPEEPIFFYENLFRLKGISIKKFRKRDEKPWYKPPKWFKVMKERQFRAKCKNAMFNEVFKNKDGLYLPFRKSLIWDWT